jgi:hypothetical protein
MAGKDVEIVAKVDEGRWDNTLFLQACHTFRTLKTWMRKVKGEEDRYAVLSDKLNAMPMFFGRKITKSGLCAKFHREVSTLNVLCVRA